LREPADFLVAGGGPLRHQRFAGFMGSAAEGISGEKSSGMQDVLAKRNFKFRQDKFDLIVLGGHSPATQFVDSSFEGHDGTRPISAITTI
jgi:hypothetical protein